MKQKDENYDMSPARKEPDIDTYAGRVAVRLRSLREKAGLTHGDVAQKLGVTIWTIYSWEQGRHFPQPDQFPILKELFGVKTIHALFPKE
jgi:DNA-binding XRE family transcriptional regulator